MEQVTAVLAILGALLLGAMSPGPSFVFVVRTSLAMSRTAGAAAAVGMGVGGFLYAVVALTGLSTVLLHVPQAYTALKIVGGVYLVFLAVRIWRAANRPVAIPADTSGGAPSILRPFAMGLATQLSNPKTALVYASVFAAFMPQRTGPGLLLLLPVLVFAVEGAWYLVVAMGFSAAASRQAYLRSKRWINRAAGAVMGSLGIALLLRPRPS